ncbi:phosphate acyltransferase [Bacteroidota bacterium]
MKIGLDLMGGDFAPASPMQGVIDALNSFDKSINYILLGDLEDVKLNHKEAFQLLSSHTQVTFIDAPDRIDMSESPTKSFATKSKSSISIGYQMLASSDIDVLIGAGNTGAMMVGAYYAIKPIEGIIRPAISSFVPQYNGKRAILLDVGVNPDVRQDVLFQFGLLGSAYSKMVEGVEKPRVALLNIGSEPEKGNLVSHAAYSLLEATSKIDFVGNIEGYDLFSDKADVIVTDGFTGNVVLKMAEGFYRAIKADKLSSPFIDTFNYEFYGGTPILGVNKAVIVGHGISSPLAFKNMIGQAYAVVQNDLVSTIKSIFRSINNY